MKSIFCALCVLCGLNLLAAVTVHKAPLKSLLIDNASVVTNVTATPEAAKKLESTDGNSWLDADGVKWANQKAVEWDGLTALSEIGDGASFNFSFESPEWLMMSVSFYAPNEWYAQRSRIEDVEAGDGSGIVQEEVQYDFEATAPANASTIVLYNVQDRNHTTTIRVSDVVREVERFATTGEVARIASGISGGLTTNDVCAIITKEESVLSDWVLTGDIDPKAVYRTSAYVYHDGFQWVAECYVWGDLPGCEETYRVAYYEDLGETKREIMEFEGEVVDMYKGEAVGRIRASRSYVSRNVHGLARLSDIDISRHLTTNEVGDIAAATVLQRDSGLTDWEFTGWPDTNVVFRVDMETLQENGTWFCEYEIWDVEQRYRTWSKRIELGSSLSDVLEVGGEIHDMYAGKFTGITVRGVRSRYDRNALGLAMAKDVVSAETVTNVARSVVNSVWDASLGVAWEARMHNGHLYYIAVTNRPPEGK